MLYHTLFLVKLSCQEYRYILDRRLLQDELWTSRGSWDGAPYFVGFDYLLTLVYILCLVRLYLV